MGVVAPGKKEIRPYVGEKVFSNFRMRKLDH